MRHYNKSQPRQSDPVPETFPSEAQEYPQDWTKGALLNVRNGGETYVITLFPEEYDPRHPERSIQFHNSALCQDFVSKWYQRENSDPRAR